MRIRVGDRCMMRKTEAFRSLGKVANRKCVRRLERAEVRPFDGDLTKSLVARTRVRVRVRVKA